jgi:hypothetical protein
VSHFRVQLTVDRRPKRLIAVFDALAVANQDLVSVVPSRFKHIHPALVINEPPVTPYASVEKACREICHIHCDKDFSLHAMVSPQACKTGKADFVLRVASDQEKLGRMHPLSGSYFLLKEYVLFYAPHDEELAMVARCICTEINYMLNVHVVKQ